MMGQQSRADVAVWGISVAVPSVGGPALTTRVDAGVVVIVSDENRQPVTGLSENEFSASVLENTRNGPKAKASVMREVTEPIPGVYVLSLDHIRIHGEHRAFACVVDVNVGGGRGARVLVPIDR